MRVAEDLTRELLSPHPRVKLVNAFHDPFDHAVAAARTAGSQRLISAAEVGIDEQSRRLRDRVARETYEAGHHGPLQLASFQFTLENVSHQFVWSFLHSHPFSNSEQVGQSFVDAGPVSVLVPSLGGAEEKLFRAAARRMLTCHQRLLDLLTETSEREYFALFPARQRDEERWGGAVRRKCQEVAAYVLPIGTFTHLYHTVSGLTLHRYHRLMQQYDVPHEAALVVEQMIEEVNAQDPLFFREIEDPLRLEDTLEHRLLTEHRCSAGGSEARAFVREFDDSLCGRRSKLVDYNINAEAALAQAVRSVLGLSRASLSDEDAILAVLSPALAPLLAEPLELTTLSKLTRTLAHPHYTFRKKLSHAADCQDQRHRMVPGSRPVLHAQYAGADSGVVVPELLARAPAARDLYLEECGRAFGDIDRLLSAGVSPEDALYLLPNGFPIRFEQSGDLLHLHHKWTTQLCFTAQEELWRASKEEVEQVRAVHPRLGAHLMPPCQLRDLAQVRPLCPEGPGYCGVPVWRVPVDEFDRVI